MNVVPDTSTRLEPCFGERLAPGDGMPVPSVVRKLDIVALFLLLIVAAVWFAGPAIAFTAPTTGDLAFEIYDIIINQGIEGPLGAMIAVVSIVIGIFGIANRNWFAMGGGFAGTTAMVAGEDIVTTVGFII